VTALSRLLGTTTFRLLLLYLGLMAAGSLLLLGAIVPRIADALTRQTMAVIAAEVGGLREQYQIGGMPLLADTVTARSAMVGANRYYLADATGRKLAGNLDMIPRELAGEPQGGLFRYVEHGDGLRRERTGVGLPVPVEGGATLVVGRDIEDQQQLAASLRQPLLWSLALTGLAGLGGALYVSHRVLRRIDAMAAASALIMAGDLARRLPVAGSGNELDRLAQTLNVMLGRIEQLMAGLKEVSDNIAHDLKTPLTRLRNSAEAALRDATGEPAFRRGLERTIEEADGLIKTFNALLSIARMEAGGMAETKAVVDLSALVEDSAELYQPVAEEAGFTLSAEAETGLQVLADRQLVGQAIVNLIENALKYGASVPPRSNGAPGVKGSIEISVAARAGRAEIAIADHGAGIPAADRERVLKRFVRLDASRSQPGSGLGLSLVAAVARALGGEVRLEDNRPGLRCVLALPLALPPGRLAAPAP
jgi:signal transduction histidine kinase